MDKESRRELNVFSCNWMFSLRVNLAASESCNSDELELIFIWHSQPLLAPSKSINSAPFYKPTDLFFILVYGKITAFIERQ